MQEVLKESKNEIETQGAQMVRDELAYLKPTDDELIFAFKVVAGILEREAPHLGLNQSQIMAKAIETGRTVRSATAVTITLIKTLSTAKSHKPTCGLHVGCE